MFRLFHGQIIRLLRWSEKYTGTDMVYLAHGSFWLSGSSLLTGLISFGLALAFANLFTPHEYGIYKYILTLFGIYCIFCLRGMDMVVTQAAARGNDQTVVSGLWAKIRWSLIGSVGALIGAAYYFYNDNAILGGGLIVAALFIPLMEPLGIFNSVLLGKKNFKLSSMFGIAGQIGSAIPLVIALALTDNPIVIFFVYCASWTLTRYISFQITLKKYPPNGAHEPNASAYALHSSVIGGSNSLISSLDSVLIFHFLGAADLALYAFALAPVSHAKQFIAPITTLIMPKLAPMSSAAVDKLLVGRTGKLAVFGLIATAGYCILAYPFFHIFFPQYVAAIPFSQVFSLTIFIQTIIMVVSAAIDSRLTLVPKHLLYLWNIPGIVVALCALLLIPYLGLWGAIIGNVLSLASVAGISWFIWSRIKDKEHADVISPSAR